MNIGFDIVLLDCLTRRVWDGLATLEICGQQDCVRLELRMLSREAVESIRIRVNLTTFGSGPLRTFKVRIAGISTHTSHTHAQSYIVF